VSKRPGWPRQAPVETHGGLTLGGHGSSDRRRRGGTHATRDGRSVSSSRADRAWAEPAARPGRGEAAKSGDTDAPGMCATRHRGPARKRPLAVPRADPVLAPVHAPHRRERAPSTRAHSNPIRNLSFPETSGASARSLLVSRPTHARMRSVAGRWQSAEGQDRPETNGRAGERPATQAVFCRGPSSRLRRHRCRPLVLAARRACARFGHLVAVSSWCLAVLLVQPAAAPSLRGPWAELIEATQSAGVTFRHFSPFHAK